MAGSDVPLGIDVGLEWLAVLRLVQSAIMMPDAGGPPLPIVAAARGRRLIEWVEAIRADFLDEIAVCGIEQGVVHQIAGSVDVDLAPAGGFDIGVKHGCLLSVLDMPIIAHSGVNSKSQYLDVQSKMASFQPDSRAA